jgi:hypothetical protein
MIKQMRQKPMAKTPGSDTLSEIAEKPFTAALAAAGGLGLADTIVEDVASQEGLAATLAEHPEVMGPNWRQRIAPSRLYKPVSLGGPPGISDGDGAYSVSPATPASGASASVPSPGDSAASGAPLESPGALRRAPDVRAGRAPAAQAAAAPEAAAPANQADPAGREAARASSDSVRLVSLLAPPADRTSVPAAGKRGAVSGKPGSAQPPARGGLRASGGTLTAAAAAATPGAQEAFRSSRATLEGSRGNFRRGPGAHPAAARAAHPLSALPLAADPLPDQPRATYLQAVAALNGVPGDSEDPSPRATAMAADDGLIIEEDLPPPAAPAGPAPAGPARQTAFRGDSEAASGAEGSVLTGRAATDAWARLSFRPERTVKSGTGRPSPSGQPAFQAAQGAQTAPGASNFPASPNSAPVSVSAAAQSAYGSGSSPAASGSAGAPSAYVSVAAPGGPDGAPYRAKAASIYDGPF